MFRVVKTLCSCSGRRLLPFVSTRSLHELSHESFQNLWDDVRSGSGDHLNIQVSESVTETEFIDFVSMCGQQTHPVIDSFVLYNYPLSQRIVTTLCEQFPNPGFSSLHTLNLGSGATGSLECRYGNQYRPTHLTFGFTPIESVSLGDTAD